MGDRIRIRFTVVNDEDFTPSQVLHVDVELSQEVADVLNAIREVKPSLKQYDLDDFSLLRIKVPVSTELEAADTRKRNQPQTLAPILQRLRERSNVAGRTELANEYVEELNLIDFVKDKFEKEHSRLISLIVVRHTSSSELLCAKPI